MLVSVIFLMAFLIILVALCSRSNAPGRAARRGSSSGGRTGIPSNPGYGSTPFERAASTGFGAGSSSPSLTRMGSGSMRDSDGGATRSLSRGLSNALGGVAKAFSKTSSRESLPMFEKKKGARDDKFSV